MASSDNVLRGGLTKKHVDVPELMKVLDFVDGPIAPLRPRAVDDVERVYETPAREFRLSVIDLKSRAGDVTRDLAGPEILLVTGGSAKLGDLALGKGQAVFVPACLGKYTLDGDGVVYRATVGPRG